MKELENLIEQLKILLEKEERKLRGEANTTSGDMLALAKKIYSVRDYLSVKASQMETLARKISITEIIE